MTKLDNTDIYVRKIKFLWIQPLLMGGVKEDQEQEFLIDLIFKCICDESGKDIKKEDLGLDDFIEAQKYITSKISPEKKS